MDPIATLQAVINTLDTISVSGANNLDRMLGSIQVLKKLKNDLESKPKPREEKPDD